MTQKLRSLHEMDYSLLTLIIGLQIFGVIMLFSASYGLDYYEHDSITSTISSQIIWIALGLIIMMITANINYRFWRDYSLLFTAVLLLVLGGTFLFADPINNAKRWIRIGSYTVQPSEFAKVTTTIYIAHWLSSKGEKIRDINYGLIPFALLVGFLVSLIVLEPDLSTSLVIVITAVAMFVIAGADVVQLGILLSLFGGVAVLTVNFVDYAHNRFTWFLESFTNPLHSEQLQIRLGAQALYEGGWFGNGLASAGVQYMIPAQRSDSIFAIVGYELGIVGCLLLIVLFLFFAWRGVRIALQAEDAFGTLLASGITAWIITQAFIHMAVVLAMFPNTGLPLPFFSDGGSSTVANLAAMGILLNISRAGRGGINVEALPALGGRNRRSRVSNTRSRRRPQKKGATTYARKRR